MTNELAEAKAALRRIAAGTNHAGDIRAVRVAIERLDELATPPADDVREALVSELRQWAALIGTEPRGARELFTRAADALAEVRSRGTVTAPNVDLVEVIGVALVEWRSDVTDLSTPHAPSLAEYVADAVWRAQWHHNPSGTVTDADAEVEAGAWALLDRGMDLSDRSPSHQVFDEAKADARAVLETARKVPRGD